jgi:hypothetical protein
VFGLLNHLNYWISNKNKKKGIPFSKTIQSNDLSSSSLAKHPSFLAIQFLGLCQAYLFHSELDHPVFTSLDFATAIILQRKVVSLASNAQPKKPYLCI